MSDERNYDFKGLSGDAELEALLESVRRDIGEAAPEPKSPPRPAVAPRPAAPVRETAPAREAAPAAGPARSGRYPETQPAQRGAPQAQPIRQARPNAARTPSAPERGGGQRQEPRPAARRRAEGEERELPPQRERIRVVHPEDEEPEKPRRGRFGLALGIYAAVLILLLAAGCTLLWFYLDAYEVTRPEDAMESFAGLADEKYWSDALEGAFTVGETPFEDRGELMNELCLDLLRENPLEYREDEGWSESNMVYIVSAGGEDVCRVTLGEVAENGDAGFGFTYLAVTRVELLASFTAPAAHEITVTVPADASLYVNGVAVTEEYIDSALTPESGESVGELEAGRVDELFRVYRIGGLYAPAELYAADAEGKPLELNGEVTDEAAAYALGEGALDYRLLVPEGSTISVNGVELDESYNTGDTLTPAFLEGFGDYGTLPELELWLVEGLHLEPEIEVRDAEGEELDEPASADGELIYFGGGDQAAQDAHGAEAAAFMEAYAAYLSGESASEENYTALQALVLDGSELEAALKALHDDYAENGLSVERVRARSGSFVPIGSTCCVCTVDVEYSAGEDAEDVETAYTVVLVMYGGVWLAAAVVS